MIENAVLAITYAISDRFAGGGAPKLDAKLPGRAAFWGALIAAGVGFLLFGYVAALLALAWLVYRTPPWGIFGGSTNPLGAGEIAGTLARHAIAVPLTAGIVYWTGGDWVRAAVGFGVFALVSTILAIWYGKEVKDAMDSGQPIGDQNAIVEILRGALYGMTVGVVL